VTLLRDFDGETYERERDQARLERVYDRVWQIMKDGQARSLPMIATLAKCSETSASARLRDFRKAKFGAHTVERKYLCGGMWLYRLVLNNQEPQRELALG
jgi:hypothetical protein